MWVPPQVVDKPLSIRCQYHSVLVSTLVPTLSNYEQCKSRDLPVDASSVKIFRFFEKINFVQITTSSKNIFEQFFVNFILKNAKSTNSCRKHDYDDDDADYEDDDDDYDVDAK